MRNIKIQNTHFKRKKGRQTQFIIKRNNEDLEESQEQIEKLFAIFKKNAPKKIKIAMQDEDI